MSRKYTPKHVVRKSRAIVLTLLLTTMLAPMTLFAQQGKGKTAIVDTPRHEPYNLATVETLRGTVARIDQLPGRREGVIGIHAMLETATETIEVHFGPYSFLKTQSTQIKAGDEIAVTGSRITIEDKPAILAAEVKRGEEVLTLRDENGKPLWRGKGRR